MTSYPSEHDAGRPTRWTFMILALWAPLLATLFLTLWRLPYPVNEAVALFEDAARRRASDLWMADTSYYRPLFHLTMMGIWRLVGPLETKLALIKLVHLVPIALLVVLFIWHLRPKTFVEAAA